MIDLTKVICVGLMSFESDALWWIGYHIYSMGEEGTTFEDVDTHEDFSSLFEGTECIESHTPEDTAVALSRAGEITRKEQRPLYRMTHYTDENGAQCEVYERM